MHPLFKCIDVPGFRRSGLTRRDVQVPAVSALHGVLTLRAGPCCVGVGLRLAWPVAVSVSREKK